VGVANSFGASWSVAKLELATGEATPVHKVDCCTPDWFPDSRAIIFSWRPPKQKSNPGYGWTQLWRTDLDGKMPQLVYGEDGRHVYGGQVSPDGKYVLFTGNMQEDGDPGNAGAPMGLMRLSDGPIIEGASEALRTVHPQTQDGPVLVLPAGWEPHWTASELFEDRQSGATDDHPALPLGTGGGIKVAFRSAKVAAFPTANGAAATAMDSTVLMDAAGELARELHDRGWIVFSQQSDRGDWDLLRMRPDGTDRQKLTDTPEFHEAGVRYSPDGTRMLYYRLPISDQVDNNTYGTHELIVADADGTHAEPWGRDYPWATWGPDGKQIACLTRKEIQVCDVATRKLVTSYPRSGMVSQLTWSPDGSAFLGTANGLGPYWNIGVLACDTRTITAVSEIDRYNCTSDWSHDGQSVLYARGIIPEQGGHAELWSVRRDGTSREILYAESCTHVYGACSSPDGRFLLFTRSVGDLGPVDDTRTTMSIVRRSDTPMHGEESKPRLDLGPGWEPDWTMGR
jgi:Tol biopolymer transport system component